MPGLLKPDAKCPECGEQLVALADTTNSKRVIREYFHLNKRKRCVARFDSHAVARIEREALEVSCS